MIQKKLIRPERVRTVQRSFAAIEHRFVRDGFWMDLTHDELLLYFLLVLVADRHGLSYYSYDKLCELLRLTADEYIEARNALIDLDLLAFDGTLFQVLSLPSERKKRPGVPETSPRTMRGWQ